MARQPLSELDDWELVYDEQDLRGRRLLDAEGRSLGTVTEMIVDTDEERVDVIVLDNGREIPASAFEIRDRQPVLLTAEVERPRAEVGEAAETIPLAEERLLVRRRPVQRGAVEVERRVVEEQQTVPVELHREELWVEQRDVDDRPISAEEAERHFAEGTIRVPVRGEEAVVAKEAVVTGEVVVGKEQTVERQEITDTVRRTEAEIQAEGDVDIGEGRRR